MLLITSIIPAEWVNAVNEGTVGMFIRGMWVDDIEIGSETRNGCNVNNL